MSFSYCTEEVDEEDVEKEQKKHNSNNVINEMKC